MADIFDEVRAIGALTPELEEKIVKEYGMGRIL